MKQNFFMRLAIAIAIPQLFVGAVAMARIMPFSPLTGPFAVGTVQYQWVDQSRHEIFTSDPGTKRSVIVQVWYPARPNLLSRRAPYLLSPVEFLNAPTDSGKMLLQVNSLIETRSYFNAPMATGQRPFPVLIFNPGGGNPRFTSSFVTEQLASQGFVVFAIEHVGDSMGTHLPDGTPLDLDALPAQDPVLAQKMANGTATVEEIETAIREDWETLEHYQFPVALADSEFVINRLSKLNTIDPRFRNKLDLNRVGALGWSMGGAQAIQLLVHDRRIKAAVDMDGQFFGNDKNVLQTSKPFLLFHSTEHETGSSARAVALKHMSAFVESWYEQMTAHSTGPRFRARVMDTDHGSFSDWRIFFSYRAGGEQRMKATLHEQVISNMTVAFFKRYLLCENNSLPAYPPQVLVLKSWDADTAAVSCY